MRRPSIPSLVATLMLTCATSTVQAKPPPAVLSATGAASSAAPAPPASPAASSDAADPTRALFEEGTADLNAGKFAEAAEKLRAVWQQKKSYDVAGNLGAALLKLGRHAEAARFLVHARDSYPAGGKPSVKQWLEEMLADAKRKASEVRLTVTGDAPAHEVRIDGAAIEAALVGASLFVEPGKRTIEASAKGYVAARQTVEAKEGQAADVTLALVAAPVGGERSMLWPAIAFGVGGAGLVAGIVGGAVVASLDGNLSEACKSSGACPPGARGNLDGARTASYVSTTGFIVAGLGAAVGATLLLWPSAQPKDVARAVVVVGPGSLILKGAF